MNHVIPQLGRLIRRYPFIIRILYPIYRSFQPRFTIGVVGVLVNEVGHILIVEHVFHPQISWGLPGGWIGRNEEPAEAVVRELEEELQLNITVKQILYVEKPSKNHIDMAFLCESSNSIGKLSNELLSYQWADPSQFPPLKKFHKKAIKIALNTVHRS